MRTEDGARAWQTLIFTAGSNLTQAAQVHANVHAETGESLPVLWEWNAWRTLPSAEPALLDASLANFSQLYDVLVERFPQLPSSPFGIALGDEPPWELVHGRLSASAAAVKRRYPHAITHINLQFRTITNASVPPILGAASGLDWVGSDLYYSDNTVQPPVNASVAAFREIYSRAVYPHLRPDQKIVLVPFAHCKRSSPLRVNSFAPQGSCCAHRLRVLLPDRRAAPGPRRRLHSGRRGAVHRVGRQRRSHRGAAHLLAQDGLGARGRRRLRESRLHRRVGEPDRHPVGHDLGGCEAIIATFACGLSDVLCVQATASA